MSERRGGGNPKIGFDESWYYDTAHGDHDYPALDGSTDADVCVVGGGYTGLSAAIELARKGYSVVLLEGYKIGSGSIRSQRWRVRYRSAQGSGRAGVLARHG